MNKNDNQLSFFFKNYNYCFWNNCSNKIRFAVANPKGVFFFYLNLSGTGHFSRFKLSSLLTIITLLVVAFHVWTF